MTFIPTKIPCCKHCGHVTYYRGLSGRYECMRQTVDPRGICDRYTKDVSSSVVLKRIDASMRELKSVPDGNYEIKKRPSFMENYRILSDEELQG